MLIDHRLPNGVPAIVIGRPNWPVVGLVVLARSGSRYEEIDLLGISHLLEHALLESPAADGWTAGESLGSLGGNPNATTTREYLAFTCSVGAAQFPGALARLADAVTRPRFTAESWASHRSIVEEELRLLDATPQEAVKDLFAAVLFRDHPLAVPVGGTVESIRRITVSAAGAFHAERFRAESVCLIVVGDLAEHDIQRALAVSSLGDLSPGSWGPQVSPQPLLAHSHRVRDGAGSSSSVMIGAVGVEFTHPMRPAFDVLASILGGGPFSLLYRLLRNELGLAYSVTGWHTAYTDTGVLRLQVDCATDAVEAVVGRGSQLFADLPRHVTSTAVDAAGRIAIGQSLVANEASTDLALWCGIERWLGGDYGWTPEKYWRALRRVSREDILEAHALVVERGISVAVASR